MIVHRQGEIPRSEITLKVRSVMTRLFARLNVPSWLRRLSTALKRRSILSFMGLFAGGLYLSLALAACSSGNSANTPTSVATNTATPSSSVLRIGYQKSATLLNALKSQGTLEKRLQPQGITVQWSEFSAGPAILEGLNVGQIDFGYTGETPPIFAQAANAPLVYVAYETWGPKAEAILIPKDSPIQNVADLKGKKVALNKGSNVHYLLVQALENAGLQYSDITPVFLPPADARAAFEQGSVDAWVIWDPYLAVAETAIGAKILTDGTGLVENRGFFLASQKFVEQNSPVITAILDELKTTSEWAKTNPQKVAEFLSKETGIDVNSLLLAESRRSYSVEPLTSETISSQQKIADTFYRLQLIPQQISIQSAVKNLS